MDAMKIIQMALDAAAQTSDEPLDGVSRNADGTMELFHEGLETIYNAYFPEE